MKLIDLEKINLDNSLIEIITDMINQPEVKAIPIEWIKDFAKKQNRGNYKDFIDFMINFWERTNE